MNLVQLEQRSLTEWIQLAKLIWVALNSDLIWLMWSTVSEPGQLLQHWLPLNNNNNNIFYLNTVGFKANIAYGAV